MKLENVTFGSDVEFFVSTLSNEPIPAIGMVGGTKEKPRALGQGYYIQEDNVAVEFNIPVAKSADDLRKKLITGFNKCRNELPAAIQPMFGASMKFKEHYLNNPKAMEFGCEPDINAWTRKINPRPRSNDHTLRSAGGHIHIGWDNPDIETRFELIKACDVFVSIPSLAEDMDKLRRQLYGKAGACRIKPYGVEHRVLSNYFLFEEAYARNVSIRYQQAVNFINAGFVVAPEDNEAICETINNGDYKNASPIYRKYLKVMQGY